MVSVLKFSFCVMFVCFVICVSADDQNQGFNNINPKFRVNQVASLPSQYQVNQVTSQFSANQMAPQYSANQVTYPVQHNVQHPLPSSQIYNQYAPHPAQLPVSQFGFPSVYPALGAYPVPAYGNQFGTTKKNPQAKTIAKTVLYSVLFSTLLNRVG